MQDGSQDIPRRDADPVMSALQAAAAVPMPDVPFIHIDSFGTILVYGRDEMAIEAGELLKEHLDVTVLITPPAGIDRSGTTDFPVVKGKLAAATGHFGAFDLVIDDFSEPKPALGDASPYGPPRNGAQSRCDIILDLSGGSPLFSAADLRDGYLRVDPGNRSAMIEAVLKARDQSPSMLRCARIRARISLAAGVALIFVRRAPSRRRAITWRSIRTSAPVAGNVRQLVRRERHPTRCRRRTRCCESSA
jgi:hypothetical protein